jgi:hypothetical protein
VSSLLAVMFRSLATSSRIGDNDLR